MSQYLLESSLCLLVFYGFYHFFLRKETFFQLNRLYLLAAPILSLLIPYLNISFRKEAVAVTAFDTVLYPAIQSAQQVQMVFWEQMREPTPVFSLSVSDVLMAFYMFGVLLMTLTLVKSLWGINRLIRKGKREKQKGFTKVELNEDFPAASFFGYLFWNQQITDEQKLILEHEKVHIRQWHSLDVLVMELVVIIKWFNPLIYLFRNALKVTHEFIADQFVVQQKTNLKTYAHLLVKTSKVSATPLTNTFYSMTKKRLQMMLQQPSQKWKQTKYFLVLPMVLVLMSLFSFNLTEDFQPIRSGLAEMDSLMKDVGNTTVFEIDLPNKEKEKQVVAQGSLTSTSLKNKEADNQYQVQWGNYTFNCQVAMQGKRRVCNCEKKYIAQADLKSMNRSGIQFHKNNKKVDFRNIRVISRDGAVYCGKEDLMMFTDQQEKYDKKACIWNAFEEEDKLTVSFQTADFSRVKFGFSINTPMANEIIEPVSIVMDQERINLDNHNRNITYEQARRLMEEQVYIQYYDKKLKIDKVVIENSFQYFNGGKDEKKRYYLNKKEDVEVLDAKIDPEQLFHIHLAIDKDTTLLQLFRYTENKQHHSLTWGKYSFNSKNRFLSLQKEELVNLIENHSIVHPSILHPEGEPVQEIGTIYFGFRYRPKEHCTVKGTFEDLKKDACFKQNFAYLKHGDMLIIEGIKPSWHTIHDLEIIIDEGRQSADEILIQKSLQTRSTSKLFQVESNGKYWRQTNVSFEDLIKTLLQSKPGKLKVIGENLPRLDIYFHSDNAELTKEEIYERILKKLQSQYKFSIKNQYLEQTGWFLSAGDSEKLAKFTEEKIQPNLEFFNESVQKKGLESVGPMDYKWFAYRYFELEHGIQVTDLTEFSGRYILPLQTKDLKSLQKQLKKDYGLVLKRQQRTIPMTVVDFR